MGHGRFRTADWTAYTAANVTGRTREQVFSAHSMSAEFDPRRFTARESRDSADNPQATPIILASDVTGSMGMIAHELMRTGLVTLTSEIYARKPVPDPHIMVAAVGDAFTDAAPLQATQFEADISLASQMQRLWLEGGGGGNGGESYSAAHLLAAWKTSTDAWERHGRKGFLFTIGDEPIHDGMTREQVARVFGLSIERDLSARECLSLAAQSYEVFHIVIREGYAAGNMDQVLRTWRRILPERTVVLDDHTRIAELVVSLIEIANGRAPEDVAKSWNGPAAAVVSRALNAPRPRRFLPFL